MQGRGKTALTLRAAAGQPALVGECLTSLPPGPLHRFDPASRLIVRMEGGALASASRAEVLNGANGLAIQSADEGWELIQFLTAELVGPDTFALSGLLRGQAGTETGMGATAGAPVVALNRDLVRVGVSQSERGLPLVWRAAPSGAPPGGLAASEATFTWTGLQMRPFSPCHLRARRLVDGTIRFVWVRRVRLGGDPWLAGEPPLGEVVERYRIDLLARGSLVRSTEVVAAEADYTAAEQSADFPSGVPGHLAVEVRQFSAAYGWGAPLRRDLSLIWQAS